MACNCAQITVYILFDTFYLEIPLVDGGEEDS